jgi:regulator of sirC expression with transglutaminase-like and TPR domain
VERLLVMKPDDPEEMRDRGLLLYRLHRYGLALEALRAYLAAAPLAPDRAAIEDHVARLMRLAASMN